MTRARNQIISTADTAYYHCIARCVRRAFLCGEDSLTGQNYEHRRQWVIDRLETLQAVYCIELCAYAVMSNHYHLVLAIDEDSAADLTVDEVIERWCVLYKGPLLVQRYRAGDALGIAERQTVSEIAETWRTRLADISWFMRSLNEYIAREANQEDGCRGHFWEARFKSQALLDEQALLSCMAYVDLNPIRAGIADTPEQSEFTSVKQRIDTPQGQASTALILKRFDSRQVETTAISYDLHDYLELVDYTGRAIHPTKRGYIAADTPPILARLGIDTNRWLELMRPKGMHVATVIGHSAEVRGYLKRHQQRHLAGATKLKQLLQ